MMRLVRWGVMAMVSVGALLTLASGVVNQPTFGLTGYTATLPPKAASPAAVKAATTVSHSSNTGTLVVIIVIAVALTAVVGGFAFVRNRRTA